VVTRRLITSRLAVLVVAVGLAIGAASAALGFVVPPYGGGGESCTPKRLARIVVDSPYGATLVLRHPGPRTRVAVNGRWPYVVKGNRHRAWIESGTDAKLRFRTRCRAG
jgi:hypothetical protein